MLESGRAEIYRRCGCGGRRSYLLGCHVRGNVLQDLELLGVHADRNLWHSHSHLQPESNPHILHSCMLGGQPVRAAPHSTSAPHLLSDPDPKWEATLRVSTKTTEESACTSGTLA